MTPSYLCISLLPSEAMHQNDPPDLPNLVRLRVASITLQVYPLTDAFSPEGVVTSPHSFYESQA